MEQKTQLQGWVSRWIFSLSIIVLIMVVIGGITRLTGSGLSIVEWKPLMGAIPPLNHEQWLEVFYKYQQSPQYQLVNRGMTLSQFQWIFFWEYFHRLIGRMLGVVFVIPLFYFWFKNVLNRNWVLKLWGGFLFGGLQGLMGWLMVQSGLVNQPQVSHFRLAAHLILALFIFIYFLRLAFNWNQEMELYPKQNSNSNSNNNNNNNSDIAHSKLPKEGKNQFEFFSSLKNYVNIFLLISLLQIFYGALVAGLRAGYMMTTFPLMSGSFFPEGGLFFKPVWLNFLDNPLTVQWVHRTLAWILFFGIWFIWIQTKNILIKNTKNQLMYVLFAINAQFILGVSTLISSVFLPLAVLHQVFAFIVIATLFWMRWMVGVQLLAWTPIKILQKKTVQSFAK